MRDGGRHMGYLTLGVGIEMTHGPILPTQHIAQVTGTPTSQRHTPTNTTVQPRLSVPIAISSQHQGTT